jgi:hypothetical protein
MHSSIALRRKIYRSIEELQADLDAWIAGYNQERSLSKDAGASARRQCRPTPTRGHAFLDAVPMAKEKMIAA